MAVFGMKVKVRVTREEGAREAMVYRLLLGTKVPGPPRLL
jgi:hypothetical protein